MAETIGKLIEARLVSLLILVVLGFALYKVMILIVPAVIRHYDAQAELVKAQAVAITTQHELTTQALKEQLEASHNERRTELGLFRVTLEKRDESHTVELSKRDELNAQQVAELTRMSRILDKISTRLESWPKDSARH